jgi:outer membrane protein TolC
MMMRAHSSWQRFIPAALLLLTLRTMAVAQSTGNSSPTSNTINTPRPFDPGQNSTNPSAFAVQSQNPFLGSVPTGAAIPGLLPLSLQAAVNLALRANLGYIDSEQEHVQARAARIRALSALLPHLAVGATEEYRNLVMDSLGTPKLGIPHAPAAFSYQTTHISLQQDVLDLTAVHDVRAAGKDMQASQAAVADAKNIVVLASVSSYLLVTASQTRLETARAQLDTASTATSLIHSRVAHELSPEIDEIRARVAKRSAELRVTLAMTTLQKDKLALARIIGLPIDQEFVLTTALTYQQSPAEILSQLAEKAVAERQDIRAAKARLEAAAEVVKAQQSQRLPTAEIRANAGETGVTYGHPYRDYEVEARVSVPIFTGRRIESDILNAKAVLARRRAEYADTQARAIFDVRTALLDLTAADVSVQVSLDNQSLAQEGLKQAKARFEVGVSNVVDLLQAQQAVAEAEDNRIASVYSHQLAKLMLVRATGTAERDYLTYLGGR